ncbi:hypothetical protein [Novosphingobium sp. 9]|uniref:hypothetical protein n=1 Tax=Novosphingobium sp. 9 TaxID=2025349 RepID=UPI0021B5AE89|nr:hypothetical protein [Novosphingobium sp. 9]
MKQTTTIRAALAVAALGVTGGVTATAMAALPMMYEESLAHQEEGRIIKSPIGGIENSHWFNYRANINESRKELVSDMRHASDTEDRRDAWDEYAHELNHERAGYVKYMAKRGYRMPQVYFEGM